MGWSVVRRQVGSGWTIDDRSVEAGGAKLSADISPAKREFGGKEAGGCDFTARRNVAGRISEWKYALPAAAACYSRRRKETKRHAGQSGSRRERIADVRTERA